MEDSLNPSARNVFKGKEEMNLEINGTTQLVSAETKIVDLIKIFAPKTIDPQSGQPSGVAIALNDAVVPKSQWEQVALKTGDRIEIVTAVQGG